MIEGSVDLGFVETCEPWLLTNKFFPSKVGGQPAFLELQNIPKPAELQCKICKEPMILLCQVYASNDQVENCFHRSIFVFICRDGSCGRPNQNDNVRVFRSQLPRKNEFYSFEPPDESVRSDPVPSPVNLCRVCGCRGPSTCSRCKKVFYCGASHQKVDWKQRHKKECMEGASITNDPAAIVLPEFDLVMETETVEATKEDDEEAEKRRIEEYRELLKAGKTGNLSDVPNAELEQYGGDSAEDKTFTKFKKRIEQNPEQVLRYDRDGTPLWITTKHQLAIENVPGCNLCKAPRSFEFQVMPQLLNSLKCDELDWGVIAVYTCSVYCDIGQGYAEEFAYKQDIVKED